MKYFIKYFAPILGFILLDQVIKLIIKINFFYHDFDIITGILRFYPVINTKLSWGGNFLTVLSNAVFVNFLNIILIIVFITGYSYYRSLHKKPSFKANTIYIVGLAGTICSLIDKLFWGGSLDYIQIPKLFIFDLKDCYITIAEVLFIWMGLKYSKDISLSKYVFFYLNKLRK